MTARPMCDVSREGSNDPGAPVRTCPACGTAVGTSARARYCSRACQQRAYRLRQGPVAADVLVALTAQLRARGALVDQTVYECPECATRFVGVRRCDECNKMCRKLGLGGLCLHCDEVVLVTELLGLAS